MHIPPVGIVVSRSVDGKRGWIKASTIWECRVVIGAEEVALKHKEYLIPYPQQGDNVLVHRHGHTWHGRKGKMMEEYDAGRINVRIGNRIIRMDASACATLVAG